SARVVPGEVVERDLARLRDELALSLCLEREGTRKEGVGQFQRGLDTEPQIGAVVKPATLDQKSGDLRGHRSDTGRRVHARSHIENITEPQGLEAGLASEEARNRV